MVISDRKQIMLLTDRPVIRWLPDETVYSLASRYHYLSGNVRPDITAQQLFGKTRGGFPHDLPGGIEYLANVFEDLLGSATEIINSHTVLPAIIAFRSKEMRQDAMTALAAGAIGSLKATLGLLASRFGALLDLKACLFCLQEDRAKTGAPYWRREHQLPGVWVCSKHFCLLCVSASKRAGQHRFGWLLPHQDDLVLPFNELATPTLDDRVLAILLKIASASRAVCEMSRDAPIHPIKIANILRERLFEVGLASNSGRLHQKQIGSAFVEAMSSIQIIPELATIVGSPGAAYSQILRLLSADDVGMHPLRVVSVVTWLFDSWDAFIGRYRENPWSTAINEKNKGVVIQQEDRKGVRQLVIHMLRNDRISVSNAARKMGVDVSTVQAWAATEGICSPRRPSLIKPDIRKALIINLKNGLDKNIVAVKAGISVASVNRILRTEVGLHQAWIEARFINARNKARTEWTKAIDKGSTLGIKVIRSWAKSSYAWLYRNDRIWLNAINKSIEAVPRSNHASVDWVERDRMLSEIVEKAALCLADERPGNTISITDIMKKAPQIKAKLKRIENLPLTKRAIRSALRRHKDQGKLDLGR